MVSRRMLDFIADFSGYGPGDGPGQLGCRAARLPTSTRTMVWVWADWGCWPTGVAEDGGGMDNPHAATLGLS